MYSSLNEKDIINFYHATLMQIKNEWALIAEEWGV